MVGPITRSGERALGHMQIMPATAKEFGVEDRFNLFESGEAMGKKMAGLLKYYKNDMQKAQSAYNWGEGNLNKAIEKATKAGRDWREDIPAETQGYIGYKPGQQNQMQNQTQSMAPSWNPTPISLNVNTVKIPGQETNINLLAAGGYYTSFGNA